MSLPSLAEDARRMCQALLRMDTTNPPGNERVCAEYLEQQLGEVGVACELVEKAPGRTNLIARVRGNGKAAPILLTGHLDVVEADASQWKRPPFSGDEHEGCLWGRGAVDMRHMVAMSAAVVRRLAATKTVLDRDVIFVAVADEEAGCDYGSKYLVEEHRAKVEAEYALGEVGGFSLHIGDLTFYPVQVAEKGLVWIRARVKGTPGHGSMPIAGSVVTRLGEALARLGTTHLPVHPTKWIETFLEEIRRQQPALVQPLLRLVGRPHLVARMMHMLPAMPFSRSFSAVMSNTASATVVRAGNKTNVIPSEATFEIDGRTLPGQTDEDLLRELRAVLGPDVELEVMKSAPPTVTEPYASPMFDAIKRQVEAREPDATVVPYLMPGFTDAKYFAQTGARWYGFCPLKIERTSGIRFADMFHGNDERVPVAGLGWGVEVLDAVVRDIGGDGGGGRSA